MAEAPSEVIREAVDVLIHQQAQHLYVRGALSVAEKLYPPAPGKATTGGFELVLGKMEAQAIVETLLRDDTPQGRMAKATTLSVRTYLGYPVIVEGETGVKVRPKTKAEQTTVRWFGGEGGFNFAMQDRRTFGRDGWRDG